MDLVQDFVFYQPVKIYFGKGKIDGLDGILADLGIERLVIACDSFFADKTEWLMSLSSRIKAVFNDVQPNPQISGVKEVVRLMRENDAQAVLGFGGGSSLDTAKFAGATVYGEYEVEDYYYGRQAFPEKTAMILSVPTTSGTGAEVTQISVCNDGDYKQTLNKPGFLPSACIIDSNLMATVPPKVTMQTGLDAFSHALEGYWSKWHQPITDIYCAEAIREIDKYLERAYLDGSDVEARSHMAYAALIAGIAFGQPKTAGCHACSFPLSMHFHLAHGEACAFTLDKFVTDICYDERLQHLIDITGFKTKEALAERINYFKKLGGLKMKLSEISDDIDIDALAEECRIQTQWANSPVILSKDEIKAMFLSMEEN